MKLLCWMFGHAWSVPPISARYLHDGYSYIAVCKQCGAEKRKWLYRNRQKRTPPKRG